MDKGSRACMLDDPQGNSWVTKSAGLIEDPNRKFEDRQDLDLRLELPPGWKVRSPILGQDRVGGPYSAARLGLRGRSAVTMRRRKSRDDRSKPLRGVRQRTRIVPPRARPTHPPEEFDMSKRSALFVATGALIAAGAAYAQFPIMDRVADKVIQKYQTATCEQLWQEKAQGQGQPKPELEQRAVQLLQQDPQMRQAFFNQIAGPVMNKMFECGMIP